MSSGLLAYLMALPLVPCSKFDFVTIIILRKIIIGEGIA
jgi:hypothetical protein